jgi:hypothetical protein
VKFKIYDKEVFENDRSNGSVVINLLTPDIKINSECIDELYQDISYVTLFDFPTKFMKQVERTEDSHDYYDYCNIVVRIFGFGFSYTRNRY